MFGVFAILVTSIDHANIMEKPCSLCPSPSPSSFARPSFARHPPPHPLASPLLTRVCLVFVSFINSHKYNLTPLLSYC